MCYFMMVIAPPTSDFLVFCGQFQVREANLVNGSVRTAPVPHEFLTKNELEHGPFIDIEIVDLMGFNCDLMEIHSGNITPKPTG